jgi:hypothetical protein
VDFAEVEKFGDVEQFCEVEMFGGTQVTGMVESAAKLRVRRG